MTLSVPEGRWSVVSLALAPSLPHFIDGCRRKTETTSAFFRLERERGGAAAGHAAAVGGGGQKLASCSVFYFSLSLQSPRPSDPSEQRFLFLISSQTPARLHGPEGDTGFSSLLLLILKRSAMTLTSMDQKTDRK